MSDCILWEGNHNRAGYGLIGSKLAHRVLWAETNGPIPAKMVIHHDCENKACVNLKHLRCITHAEHNSFHLNAEPWYERQRTKTHCSKGHQYTEETTRYDKHGKRYCGECSRLYAADYHRRNRERLLPIMRARTKRWLAAKQAAENA